MYKIFSSPTFLSLTLDNVELHNCPTENTGQLGLTAEVQHTPIHGHSLKLSKKQVRLDTAKLFFSNRVINERNTSRGLLNEIHYLCFKRKLGHHLRDVSGFI